MWYPTRAPTEHEPEQSCRRAAATPRCTSGTAPCSGPGIWLPASTRAPNNPPRSLHIRAGEARGATSLGTKKTKRKSKMHSFAYTSLILAIKKCVLAIQKLILTIKKPSYTSLFTRHLLGTSLRAYTSLILATKKLSNTWTTRG